LSPISRLFWGNIAESDTIWSANRRHLRARTKFGEPFHQSCRVIDVKALAAARLKATKLEILVFGPAMDPPSLDPYVASLQAKRMEIKRRLIAEGHSVAFGEEVFDPAMPAHLASPLLQEIVAMHAADLIIVLVHSPGSILEAGAIVSKQELCPKARFYCFEEHKDGFVVKHLRSLAAYGATCDLVSLTAVQACHLTSTVMDRVQDIQAGKAFLF
jgi:hypothetical protein